jgi:hypothetical protein
MVLVALVGASWAPPKYRRQCIIYLPVPQVDLGQAKVTTRRYSCVFTSMMYNVHTQ